MSDAREKARGLLAGIILDANALRVLSYEKDFNQDQLSTLQIVWDDLLNVVGDLRYK